MIKSLLKPCCYECDCPEIEVEETCLYGPITAACVSVSKQCVIFCEHQIVCQTYNNTKLTEEESECKM